MLNLKSNGFQPTQKMKVESDLKALVRERTEEAETYASGNLEYFRRIKQQ